MRRAGAAALAALSLLVGGCVAGGGSATEPAPQGPPATRHGFGAVNDYAAVEAVRAELVATADLAPLGQVARARAHLALAQRDLGPLLGRVRASDRALARETEDAVDVADRLLAEGAPPEELALRLGLLRGQLLDGVLAALVSADARRDAGLRAAVLRSLVGELSDSYALAREPAAPPREATLAFERSYGLLARSQALAGGVAPALGPERATVLEGLARLRERAYPAGIPIPPQPAPPADVASATGQVAGALERRFALGR